MTRRIVSPSKGLLTAACAFAALTASHNACAQQEHPTRLEAVLVSALRTPQDPSAVPSSVTMLPLEELKLAQISGLSDALNFTPGVVMLSYGAVGSQSTLYVRGANSTQSLIVVDGVRMSSRQSDGYMRSVMANSGLAGLDRVEMLRGPQGTLYGSSAMGGVLLLETTHGCGPLKGSVGVETGSFSTWNLATELSGGTATLGYSASLGWDRTDNFREHNENRSLNFSTRLEQKLTDNLLIGTTFRGQESRYNSPDSRFSTYPSIGKVDSSNYLSTAYAAYTTDEFRSRLTLGWHQVSYDYSTDYGLNRYLNTREVLDWQNAWTPTKQLVLVAGANAEWAHYTTATLLDGSLSANSTGVYFNSNYSPVRDLYLQVGGRYDHFQSIGNKTTGRAGVSYLLRATGTKFRATFGTAFSVPGMTERFGDNNWYVANPGIKPESSQGWDFGFDQELLAGRVSFQTTFFKNVFRDMIVAGYVSEFGKYQYQNIARAHTQGVENALQVRVTDGLRLRVGYTYLDVVDHTGDSRVVYKPRHTGTTDLLWNATPKLVLGAGMRFVADRVAKKDWVTFSAMEDYTTVRVYASFELHPSLVLKARLENALDERYDDIYGYEGAPVAGYAGVEYRF